MGQFLPPKEQQFPATIADVKSRLRRVEHKMEVVNSKGTDTGGIEVTFSATLPDKAAVGDVWYKTSGSSVIAQYQCTTAYASGAGVQGDWSAYTTDGGNLTTGTVTSPQLAAGAVENTNLATNAVATSNIQSNAVTLDTVDPSTVTARALGGNIVTISQTEPGSPIDGDTWIEIDGTGAITSIWTRNGTWIESTIAISTAGGVEITASPTEPSDPNDGDLWINESNGNVLTQYDAATSTWNPYTFGAGAIATGAVGNAQLASGAVQSGNIASGAVGNAALASGAVGTSNIQGNAVGSGQLANGAVGGTQLASGAVGSGNLATGAVTSGAIASGAVGNTQLGTGAVQTGNIAAGAVGTTQIANGAVTGTQIANPVLGAAPSVIASGNSGSAVASYAVTCNQAVAVGMNLIVGVGGYNASTTAQTTLTDSVGNSYTLVGASLTSGEPIWVYQSLVTIALTTSTTITATTDTSQVLNIIAIQVPSTVSFDAFATSSGTSTSHSVSVNALSYAPEWVIAFDHLVTNAPTWTSPAVSLTSTSGGGGGFFSAAYASASTSASVTVSATESSSTAWTMALVSVPPTTGISGSKIAAGGISGTNLAANTVTAAQIAAGTIDSTLLAANAVTANQISAGALDAFVINAPVINGGTINGGTITAADVVLQPTSGSATGSALLSYSNLLPNTYAVTYSSNGSWTCPNNVTTVQFEGWGAGGGGGGGGNTTNSPYNSGGGAGGGGGEYVLKTGIPVVPGSVYTVTIGAGGVAGEGSQPPNQSDEQGGNGGNSSFVAGGVTYTAHGGKGGGGGMFGAVVGAGGSGGTGNVHYNGGAGGGNGGGPFGGGGGGSAGIISAGNAGGAATDTDVGTGAAAVPGGGAGGNAADIGYYPTAGSAPGGGGAGATDFIQSNGQNLWFTDAAAGARGQVKLTYQVASSTPVLTESVSPGVTTDASGNTVRDGFVSYGTGGSFIQLTTNQGSNIPYLIINPNSMGAGAYAQLFTSTASAGLANAQYQTLLQTAVPNGQTGAAIQLNSDAANGSFSGSLRLGYVDSSEVWHDRLVTWSGGIQFYQPAYATTPTSGGQETWHTLPTPSGWTVSGAGSTGVRYKLDINNGVWVQVNLSYTSGTTSGGILVGNMPAGYRPAATVSFPIRTYTATAPSNLEYVGIVYGSSPSPPSPRVVGDLYMNNMPAGATNIAFCQWIPLD